MVAEHQTPTTLAVKGSRTRSFFDWSTSRTMTQHDPIRFDSVRFGSPQGLYAGCVAYGGLRWASGREDQAVRAPRKKDSSLTRCPREHLARNSDHLSCALCAVVQTPAAAMTTNAIIHATESIVISVRHLIQGANVIRGTGVTAIGPHSFANPPSRLRRGLQRP